MEEEIEKKIKYLKEFIKEKTDLGTANYVCEELRKLCGMVETEALSQHDVSGSVCEHKWEDYTVEGDVQICTKCDGCRIL